MRAERQSDYLGALRRGDDDFSFRKGKGDVLLFQNGKSFFMTRGHFQRDPVLHGDALLLKDAPDRKF